MTKNRWIKTGLVLTIFSLFLSGVLNIISQYKMSAEIFMYSQRLAAAGPVEKIEFALWLGKPMERFYGAEDILRQIKESSDGIISVKLLDAEREVLYSYPPGSPDNLPAYDVNTSASYYTELPLSNEGTVSLLLNREEPDAQSARYARAIIYMALLLAIAAFIALYTVVGRMSHGKRAVMLVTAAAQIVFGLSLAFFYENAYLESLNIAGKIIGSSIERDKSKLISYGINEESFVGFDEYLNDICGNIPDIERISSEVNAGERYVDLGGGLYGVINNNRIYQKFLGFLLETISLTAVTLFLALEFLFYMDIGANAQEKSSINTQAARLLFFLLYFSINMGAVIIAAASYQLCLQNNGSGFLVGIPVTLEMGAGLAAVLLSGVILNKIGYAKTLYDCIAICVSGLILSAAAHNIYIFALARAITGFGFMLSTITGRIIASSQATEQSRSQMLADLTSGTLIGFCCGAVIGGLLGDRFPFSLIFMISAAVTLCCIPIVHISRLPHAAERRSSNIIKTLRGLMVSRQALGYLAFIIFPLYAAGMFIIYAVPLYGAQIQLPTATVSALIMANSLTAAYLSPFTTRWVHKRMGAQNGIILYGLLTGASIAVFSLWPTLPVILAVIVIMGFADSFGLVLLLECFMDLPLLRHLDKSNVMIAVTLAGKAGQTSAPALLSIKEGSPLLLAALTLAGTFIYLCMFLKPGTEA
ncbi:MAG: MFS transporter [Clostridiales bacterium]|jgi:predicted MFS family arabinose efflux permease|nr:MFS transporter [Clostridiales bacterium]